MLLLNHLVGATGQWRRRGEAKRHGRFESDDQLDIPSRL